MNAALNINHFPTHPAHALKKQGWFVHPEQEDQRWILICKLNDVGRSLMKKRVCSALNSSGKSPCNFKELVRLQHIKAHVSKCFSRQHFSGDGTIKLLELEKKYYGKFMNI